MTPADDRMYALQGLIVGTLLVLNSTVSAQKFEIDPDHASIVFAVSHFGLSYTYGRFNECSGSFELNRGEPTADGFKFKVAAKSIDTNNGERDEHLRGPDFFDTEKFPEITFETVSIEKFDDKYQVIGKLRMLDVVRTVTMPVQLIAVRTGPFGKLRAGCFTKFTIRRSDFGMDNMLGPIGDKVSVTFSFEGVAVESETDSRVSPGVPSDPDYSSDR